MKRTLGTILVLGVFAGVALAAGGNSSAPTSPTFVKPAVMFSKTLPLRQMNIVPPGGYLSFDAGLNRRERGPVPPDNGFHGDPSLKAQPMGAAMPGPLFTFEGPSNADNQRIFGGRVVPPDPNGDVGRNHYIAMVNLTFAIYDKQGTLLFGPADIGTLWQGFPVDDCTDPSGDPVVLYDHLADRWILTQFTTAGPEFFNCVAISQTSDPLGAYFLYAFSTGLNFPDYPKYGMWPNAYYITTREFDPNSAESIGIYAVERKEMLKGNPNARVIKFQLTQPAYLVGDGLLPADLDGPKPPKNNPYYLLGTMDDGAGDGAPFDGLNMFEARVFWSNPGDSNFKLANQIQINNFDTIYPCNGRQCIPQPGTTVKLDILSYRQRPTWRLQYRNRPGLYQSLVTNQSVEAMPGVAGVRWWEIRSPKNPVLRQDGVWQPGDGVHRWMGSIAQDKKGNMAVGYSVSNASDVFPGIRYAGRLRTDPKGQMSQGEAVLQAGGGSQTTTAARWGDYTSMNVDPSDGCTFYYINEYYAFTDSLAWQTRIGAFKFPNCQ